MIGVVEGALHTRAILFAFSLCMCSCDLFLCSRRLSASLCVPSGSFKMGLVDVTGFVRFASCVFYLRYILLIFSPCTCSRDLSLLSLRLLAPLSVDSGYL